MTFSEDASTPPPLSKLQTRWRILACDLDGTLIGRDHKILDRDLDALRRARAAGIHIAVCSGRNSIESGGVITSLDLTGLGVFTNGAMVADMTTGKTLHSRYLQQELADEVIDFFGSRGHAVLMLIDDAESRMPTYLFTDHGPPHRATKEWLLANRMHSTMVNELPPQHKHRVVRLGVIVDNADAPEIKHALHTTFAGRSSSIGMYSPYYDCFVVELFTAGTNKWTGIQYLAQAMNCGEDQIITIGDEINDVEMLKNARLSFAMGNATPEVQACAKRVTAPQTQCGVTQVIDQLLAGKLEPD